MEVCGRDGGKAEAGHGGVLEVRAAVGEVYEGHCGGAGVVL